ncbi:MAG TPA: selenide, water dikinase SelD, partial [Pirellulales bacterium]|nr:selenide, water dikinase SelD [Pirellulales bacterium]
LAGLYPPGRLEIDLVRLCAAAGARLLRTEVSGLDLERRQLLCPDRPAIPFDVLSIGIGSVPKGAGRQSDAAVVPIKPMQDFIQRLDERLQVLDGRTNARPIEMAVVGGGAGGVEIACCLPAHLERHWPNLRFRLTLVDRGREILPGASAGVIRLARRVLDERGVELLLGRGAQRVSQGGLLFDDGSSRAVDLAVWAAGAAAPPLLAQLGLPCDEEGFLLTRPTLQTVADAPIFVVGDSGSCPEQPRPKAGVYAVRQGPILWENIQRMLRRHPLAEYRAQKGFLSLLATGDRRAILSYKGFAARAAWCWKLKDYIDGRFMDKYQDYRPRTMPAPAAPPRSAVPRCAGCGGKVGSSVLSKVLARLDVPASEHVLVGLEAPDDAAVLRPVDGRPIIATVDFFTAFVDDPYLVGRVAALNAMSDVFALGGQPLAALAMVTIPPGRLHQQEQLLYELLAGGLRELRAAGATLVGGHTIEADQLTIGYTLLGDTTATPTRLKGGLRPGDKLLLTKPLGSGILLAAHMRAACRAAWMDPLSAALLASNEPAGRLAADFDVGGMTDVTGFGLAGHLLEMLRASQVSADLDLSTLPLLPGVPELVSQGIESTLAPSNRSVEADIEWTCGARDGNRAPSDAAIDARVSVLFDPQTSGGLLIGLRPADVEPFLAQLSADATLRCAVIGEVAELRSAQRPLRVHACPSGAL